MTPAIGAFDPSAAIDGSIPNLPSPNALFAEDGHHLSELGNYFIALAQFSGLYQQGPAGAPLVFSGLSQPVTVSDAQATALETAAWQAVQAFAPLMATPPTLPECQAALKPFCEGSVYLESLLAEELTP